jgi:putative phosphoesterase
MEDLNMKSRLAFFSDVHGNSVALRAVLDDIKAQGVEGVYCLGDLIGYGPDPNGVVQLLRQEGIPCLLGNYDDGVAFARGSCGCYYSTESAKKIGAASYAFTLAELEATNRAWLQGLPGELRLQYAGVNLHLVHGSPRRINEYLLQDRDERTYERLAAAEAADVLLFGHTHQAWHRRFGRVLFVNVGSAGRPTDGDPRASYTLLTLPELGVEVRRVAYNVEETAAAVIAAGLPLEIAHAFRLGRGT